MATRENPRETGKPPRTGGWARRASPGWRGRPPRPSGTPSWPPPSSACRPARWRGWGEPPPSGVPQVHKSPLGPISGSPHSSPVNVGLQPRCSSSVPHPLPQDPARILGFPSKFWGPPHRLGSPDSITPNSGTAWSSPPHIGVSTLFSTWAFNPDVPLQSSPIPHPNLGGGSTYFGVPPQTELPQPRNSKLGRSLVSSMTFSTWVLQP